jgi:lysophospholipase L1-like esterase
MDITTLAAAKKYTDDKLISSGNSGAVVDSTLTTSGAAADAKATGDKIKELNTKFDNIEFPDVPTKVSELENDSEFITTEEAEKILRYTDKSLTEKGVAAEAEAVGDALKQLKLEIPTKVSQLANDNGYITLADIPEIDTPENSGDFGQFVEKLGDGVNKYEPQTEGWVDDAILNNNGVPNYNASTYKAYAVTPEIPIKGSTTYTVKPKPYATSLNDKYKARTYDSSGTALDYMTYTENEDGSATFTTPENSATLRITIHTPTFGGKTTENANDLDAVIENFNSTFMLVEGTEAPEVYEPFGNSGYKLKNIALPDKSVNIENVSDEALPIFARLAGKKIANFGDSIFGNARPPKDVSTFLAENTGAEVLNCAFGGCRMGSHTGHWDCFSMYRLADAIASNDYSLQEDALNYDDRVSYAEEPLALIKSTDFSTVDILTIAYGTNDFTGGNKIDNTENLYDTSTLGGALRYSIEKLLTAFPNLRIVILSTTWRFWKDENNEYIEDSKTYLNKYYNTLPEYNAKLKAIAAEYNLPFIDNYNIGIGKFNRYQYFHVTDGTHHNETGRRLIAEHLANALQSSNGHTYYHQNFNTESVPGGGGLIMITDPTLTLQDAPADAKAVGDKFTSLELKMLTDDDIPEIARQAAALIDTALLSILGDGVIE